MIHRHLTGRILDSLSDTPVVYLQGARQTGKSTLVQAIAKDNHSAEYLSLDTAAVLSAAQSDPEGFIAGLAGPVVIDEVQRAPALALAIKSAVDAERRPGRFLLTGSASVTALPHLSESLAGRMELHTLWPFSQGEINERRETFVERVFKPKPALLEIQHLSERDLIEQILVGGYPEPLVRKKSDRRHAWFDSYITTTLHRDVRDLSNIDKPADVSRLLALLASRTCALVNYAELSRSLSMPQTTLKRYMALLEATFLIRLLPAWSSNLGKRLVKSSKLVLGDTGVLGHVLGLDRQYLGRDRTLLGHVLENFVAMELMKQLGWSQCRCRLFHFRTTAGQEVDFVLEDSAGRLVGIEMKSAATIGAKDFRGLKVLAELTGNRFQRGFILYTGHTVVPFAKNLQAVPVNHLWEC